MSTRENEIDNIDGVRPDADTLQADVVEVSDSLRDLSNDRARIAADFILQSKKSLKATGVGTMGKVEKCIKLKPAQSLGIAFAVGVLASFLLHRRFA